jgi:hypothetical protein
MVHFALSASADTDADPPAAAAVRTKAESV